MTMKPKEEHDPAATPAPTSAPLADLVDAKLNTSLADQLAEALAEKPEEPSSSVEPDYARGTAEHDDDEEA
jgi:hypothetical protein